MEVKPGYKRTEVGIIPEEWNTWALTSISDVRDGTHESPRYVKRGVPFVTSKNIVEGKIDLQDITFISEEDACDVNRRSKVDRGDILISMIGTVGNAAFVDFEPGFCIKNVALIKPDTAKVNGHFLIHLFRSPQYGQYIESKLKGGIQKFISLGVLRGLYAPLPPTLAEQEAIAAALSDADALIESLEQLIVKKRQVKQGAMQELLTGKRRLPGFLGEWDTKPLQNVAPLQRGFDLPNSRLQQGPYPVVYSNGILNYHSAFQAKGPGVVTGRSGTIGAVTFVEQDFWPHNTSLWVTTFKGNDPKFIFYLYTRIGFERFASGSGVPTLNRNDVHAFKVKLPPTKAEQTAIAAILSDIDAELFALEAKLVKARQVKQGMMQELLTGRIRLV